ncbi:MAG TPA: glycosyltransferase, partial [Terriglobales bacterium]
MEKVLTETGGPPAASRSHAPGSLALVVPTLHEAANIGRLLERARASLDPLGVPYELIVVDDDSQDGTENIVKQLSAQDGRVRLLVRRGEHGLAGAISDGWKCSQAEVVGVIDADLQHPPELLPTMWEKMRGGYDLVIAS